MRNWNPFRTRTFPAFFEHLEPNYEELKLEEELKITRQVLHLEPNYEELKPMKIEVLSQSQWKFRA